ncbi:hypothetical protein AK89_11790 [Enterococcus mundtii CRL35]|nr:hypothetical protein AK89_11790 [Enterococcus mundtii CRL35]
MTKIVDEVFDNILCPLFFYGKRNKDKLHLYVFKEYRQQVPKRKEEMKYE